MKRMNLKGMLMPTLIVAFLFIGISQESCAVKSCEKKITNGVVTCDKTNCPSPRRCVLQHRNKNSQDRWQDIAEPEPEDSGKEYRCLCRQ